MTRRSHIGPHARRTVHQPNQTAVFAAIACALLAMATVGCSKGPALGDVEGVVTLAGKPIGNALVTFSPDPARGTAGPRSSAVTDEQGRFTLRCETGSPGAVVGWHRISVEDLQVYNLPRNDDGSSVEEIKRVLRVPAGYAHANQTPLHEEVRSGTQHLKVELPAPQ